MSRNLLDAFPPRRLDPSERTRQYVPRALGALDPVADRRRQRAEARGSRVAPLTPIQTVVNTTLNVASVEDAQFYRSRGGPGVPDTLWVRLKNAAEALVLSQVALIGDVNAAVAAAVANLSAALNAHSHSVAVADVSAGVAVPHNGAASVQAVCATGQRVSGGCEISVALTSNIYADRPQGNGWLCAATQASGVSQTLTAYAACLEQPVQ